MISHHSNVQVPADTLRLSFNHFTVYAKSTLAAARCDGMKRMISLVNVSLVRSNQWIGKDAACFIHYPLGSKMIQVHVKLLKKKKHAVLVLQQATSDATEVLCYPEALLNSKNSSWMFVAFQFGVTGHVIPCLYHPYLGHWWVIITVILNRVGMTCIKSSLVEDRIWKTQFTKTI